jgi:flavin-dependent dehydrogenase
MSSTDLIVIGSGPAGLVAAKTAAEQGLKVTLVEMKKDIPKVTRTCAQILYLSHIGGGQAYTKPIRLEMETDGKTRIVFPDINLAVTYNGLLRACYEWRNLSPNGCCVYTVRNKLWGFVFDKEVLLRGLLDEVQKLGVTVHAQTRAVNAENTQKGAKVEIKDTREQLTTLEARYAIVANGVNSGIVENLGLNKTRETIGTTLSLLGYIMEGVECPYPATSWISFAYPSISSYINVWMGPMADGTWQLGTTAKAPGSPLEMMNRFLSDSNFASWYKKATPVKKTACSITPRFPITEPMVGNTIIIGDAGAPAETWVQGAMACASQAVHAIVSGNMKQYIDWWKESFAFNTPDYFKEFARYPALNMFFSDNELNYLYGLIDNQLVSNISDELLKHMDTIKREKPDVHEKLKKVQGISLGDTFKNKV